MTTDDDVHPDPIVRAALQLLPVPPHEPTFWADLEVALDADAAPAAVTDRPPRPLVATADAATPTPEVVELVADRALVPAGVRRRSNVVLSAVAVAAAAMVVVAGTTLVRERSGPATAELADGAGEPLDTELTSTSTSTSRSTLTAPAEGSVPTAAVLAWVEALGSGDTDTAWAALGPASQAYFGSKSAFATEGPALAEGIGAWSAASPEAVYVTSLVASGDGEVVIVTLVGTVEQEGVSHERADAFPVRVVDGTARLEPFAFAGEMEVVVPELDPAGGGRPVVQDDEVVVVVPRGIDAPMIRLDDGETLVCGEAADTTLAELEDAPGQRCTYHPAEGITPGARVLTVGFLSPDGTGIAAESVLFEAA